MSREVCRGAAEGVTAAVTLLVAVARRRGHPRAEQLGAEVVEATRKLLAAAGAWEQSS